MKSSHEKLQNVPYDTHFLLHNVTSSWKFCNFKILFLKLSEGLNKTVLIFSVLDFKLQGPCGQDKSYDYFKIISIHCSSHA